MDNNIDYRYYSMQEPPPYKKRKVITTVLDEALIDIKKFIIGDNDEYINDYFQLLEELGINKDNEIILSIATK